MNADHDPAEHPVATVTIVATPGATVGIALSAALRHRGWIPALISWNDVPHLPRAPVVVIVEDDEGRHPVSLPTTLVRCVCIGTVRSLRLLITAAERGSRVIDQASPLPILVQAVDEALRSLNRAAPAHRVVADRMRQRLLEHTAVGRLTAPERATLHALMDGSTAAEIARDTHRSMHTVRSHIKAVLAKLGVTSQLTAVAIAHRSGWFDDRELAKAYFTNVGDDGRPDAQRR